MNIVIAVHHFPPRYTGGAEWRAFRTATALLRRGYKVRVVCVEHIDQPAAQGITWVDDVYQGVSVRRLALDMAAADDRFVWQYNNPWIGAHLEQLLGEEQPDVFHLIGGYLISASAIHAAKKLNIPVVVSLTDYWFICPRFSLLRSDGTLSTLPIDPVRCARCLGEERRRYRLPAKNFPGLMNWYWRQQKQPARQVQTRLDYLMQTLNQVDAVISPSQFVRSVYIEAGADPARIHFQRQGHDFPELSPALLQKTPVEDLRVGYVGQIAAHKGVHVLVRAVRQLPELPIALDIYGDLDAQPEYAQSLRQLAAGDARIRLRGTFPRGEISAVMQNLDVVVVPSTWYENSPNAMLEAFAHRTPVIASDLGGMAELVQDGVNGWLFAAGDAQQLAGILRRLAGHRALLDEARRGILPGKSVSEEMDALERVYREIAAIKTARAG